MTVRAIHNKIVKREFTDLANPTTEWIENYTTPRGTLRSACTVQANDSAILVVLRLFLFYVICRKARDFHPPIYGLPAQDLYEQFDTKGISYPQIICHFSETRYDAANNKRMPATAQVSFRYRDSSISTTELNSLARKIKNLLATPPFKWKKGRELYTYVDRSKGYYFQIYAYNEIEAKDIIGKIWDIQEVGTPEWDKRLKKHTDDINYTIQEYIWILGENKKKAKRRPIATVEFSHAEVNIPGLLDNIVLVDTTGTYANALIYV
jgi:hypothetical protein